LFFLTAVAAAHAQGGGPGSKAAESQELFSSLNTWSAFAEYSPNSQHMFLGYSEQRRLVTFGGEYARRLSVKSWVTTFYVAQVRPVMLEGDPTLAGIRDPATGQVVFRDPHPSRVEFAPLQNFSFQNFYNRQWTYAAGLNPLGFKANFLPHRRLQPFVAGGAGFLVSARDVPIDNTSNFNFSFEFGGGLEWYYIARRSLRFDYRLHHISNAFIGASNPGIDSGLWQITYSFGK
jgi:hypothetical protein